MAQDKSKTGGGKASRFARRLEGGAGVSPPMEAETSEVQKVQRVAEPVSPPEKTVRVTVDLPRNEHRFLRVFAAQSDADGMRVMRAALRALAENEDFGSYVREQLLAEAE